MPQTKHFMYNMKLVLQIIIFKPQGAILKSNEWCYRISLHWVLYSKFFYDKYIAFLIYTVR